MHGRNSDNDNDIPLRTISGLLSHYFHLFSSIHTARSGVSLFQKVPFWKEFAPCNLTREWHIQLFFCSSRKPIKMQHWFLKFQSWSSACLHGPVLCARSTARSKEEHGSYLHVSTSPTPFWHVFELVTAIKLHVSSQGTVNTMFGARQAKRLSPYLST